MTPGLRRLLQVLASAAGVGLLVAAGTAVWFYSTMRGSLPQLDGARALAGLAAEVTVTRDVLGIPTVRGAHRRDVAQALGFLHSQDRFFQMDLLRRRASGELSALFGPVALPLDRGSRLHGFRGLSRQVLERTPAAQRELIEAYTAGVNAGLAALRRKPFEYYLLRSDPQPWVAEDSMLVAYAMVLDVQDEENTYELSLMTLRDQFGEAGLRFFAPLSTPDDAALDGSKGSKAKTPGPHVIDLRGSEAAPEDAPIDEPAVSQLAARPIEETTLHPGSNSFALSGAHTATGAGMLANDPHLNLAVPNIWYRVVLEWNSGSPPARRVMGVTIPGLPFAVIGSNGQVAWGLTTAYVDTGDLVAVEVNSTSPDLYRVPGFDELQQTQLRQETIAVRGGEPEIVQQTWTHWGPVLAQDSKHRPLAHRWTSYDPEATNLAFVELETAQTAVEAIAIAKRSGIPAHNFLVADRAGAVGWTIAGLIPERVGFDGRLPVSWTYGDRRWSGYLPAERVPMLLVPATGGAPTTAGPSIAAEAIAASGRLWTANNRIVGGAALAALGDGGYVSPPRAAQLRDRLAAIEKAAPRDLLALQLDDRALFLERWQKLLLSTLTTDALKERRSREELRRFAAQWEGRASVDSVSYRIVRQFRDEVAALTFGPIFAGCVAQTPSFNWRLFNYEAPLWAMVQGRPRHLLSPEFESWDHLLLSAADRVQASLERESGSLKHATWGAANIARIQHPLGRALPAFVGRWLDMPAIPLPGDSHMPRIQRPAFGASLRLVVSPGDEEQGILQVVGGQSGHPLSPFYRAGHEAWERGDPAPLLPGPAVHTLRLRPAAPKL